MGEDDSLTFILENSNRQKIKIFLFSLVFLVIILGLSFALFTTFQNFEEDASYYESIKQLVKNQVDSLTPAGLFYMGFGSSLFFVPLSPEPLFYLGITKGNSILLCLLMINAGFLLAQVFNYQAGKKLSRPIMYFISKRKLYKARRFINKRGWVGVCLFNLLPLPAPLLTFALGITKYNIYRLFFFMILGNTIKYGAIIGFFVITH